jgi:hypothetical protein
MEKGYISCIATQGATMIHDFEFALIGATTESVAKYIKDGQFGLWRETGHINDIVNTAYRDNPEIGMGEAVGRYIEEESLPYKSISILAAGYRLNIPVTVHIGIGYDIIHQHPNFDGSSAGALSYNDFLRFASSVQRLKGGVVMSFGSSVMAPEVFMKALSMARNIAHQRGERIENFTVLVCDLVNLPEDIHREPEKNSPEYYFRPYKSLLVRAGGMSFYVRKDHRETVPMLWKGIMDADGKGG